MTAWPPGPGSRTWGRDVIRVEALPAQDGDCLWLEWTDGKGITRRMLVDGGRGHPNRLPKALAERLVRQLEDRRLFELVVCTHIDVDHIGGLLALVDEPPPGFGITDVWFNGRDHLDVLGPAQGDHLSAGLRRNPARWNRAFASKAVVVPYRGDLPVVRLPGLTITLLSPTRAQLAELARQWPRVVTEARSDLATDRPPPDTLQGERDDRKIDLHRMVARPYIPDGSAANASSIAFVAEDDEGGRVLLAADATAEVLVASLDRLAGHGRYRVDLCKVSHHGSRHNTSPRLLEVLDCRHWLISTSGARFGHPGRETMARILCRPQPATAWFNYRTPTTEEYACPDLGARYGFTAVHPPVDNPGIALAVRRDHVEPAREIGGSAVE